MRGARHIAVLAAALATCAACTGADPAAPSTGPNNAAPVTLGSPPPVREPLDLRPFVGRVCDLLTAEQLVALGFPQPAEDGFQGFPPLERAEPRCVWDDKDERSGQLVVWSHPDTDVLAADYRGDDGEYYETVREISIDGYPGLLRMTAPESRTCKITVGVAAGQGFRVQYQEIRRTGTGICDLAIIAARGVVANLEPLPPS